ncbi:MAG: hypothetical protein ACIPMY_04180, partial [Rickettsia endosymbiont of Pentastiridius leporinus]
MYKNTATSSNMKQAKILFNTLLKAKLDSLPNYEIYETVFLSTISSCGGVSKVLENFKSDVMNGDSEACFTLAKVYEIGFYNQPKEEYLTNLFTLLGHKLGNVECTNLFLSNPTRYEILENTANKFIINYVGKNQYISLEDAILNSASYAETSMLGAGGQIASLSYILCVCRSKAIEEMVVG